MQSRLPIPEIFRSSFRPSDFVATLRPGADASSVASELARLGVEHVLAGSEPGVELADELAERLGVAGNGAAGRAARRDKFFMVEAVAKHGLRTPAQCQSSQFEELRSWAAAHGWPVVAKPRRSVASDSVAVCKTEAELERACHAIVGSRNILGILNESMLVQEFLEGFEYVVDTVSYAGQHRPAAFWRYHPVPSGMTPGVFYEAMELLPYAGERQSALFAYTCAVLDALGVRFGPAHCELIWIEGEGPVLVELGARLSAGNNAVLSSVCGGPCALEMTLDACLDPERFLATSFTPELERTAMNCFLVRPAGHRLRSKPPVDEIRQLASFHDMSIARNPRRAVVGIVTLIHPDRQVVLDDARRLRKLERTSFYERGTVPPFGSYLRW